MEEVQTQGKAEKQLNLAVTLRIQPRISFFIKVNYQSSSELQLGYKDLSTTVGASGKPRQNCLAKKSRKLKNLGFEELRLSKHNLTSIKKLQKDHNSQQMTKISGYMEDKFLVNVLFTCLNSISLSD